MLAKLRAQASVGVEMIYIVDQKYVRWLCPKAPTNQRIDIII